MKRSHRLGLALAAAAPLLLGGCQTSNVDTAMQLMQQQQQEQALAQQREDADERKRLAAKPELALSLIREAQREGRYFASLAYLDAYRQNFGDSPQVAVMRADALRMTGQIAQSESAYRALTGTDQAAAAWHGLGLLAGGRGDFDQAADYLARATRLRPTDANMLNDLGYALLRAGDPRGARLPLGQAAELAPANAARRAPAAGAGGRAGARQRQGAGQPGLAAAGRGRLCRRAPGHGPRGVESAGAPARAGTGQPDAPRRRVRGRRGAGGAGRRPRGHGDAGAAAPGHGPLRQSAAAAMTPTGDSHDHP
ncbi:tetratricopeptide repeat protein [Bordetella pertussis CHLA-20]|nr:tetratricopeptide repeat protein [Bordetella pertussis CHLA-20]